MTWKGISSIVDRVIARSGAGNDGVIRSHGLRKRCVTIMKNCGVDFSDREYLVGHKHSRGLDVSYELSSVQQRLSQYVKAIDELTINEENRLRLKLQNAQFQHSEEFTKLKKEMDELKQILQSS